MPFRLVAQIAQRSLRFTLREGLQLVGSREDCALRLDHPTVSRTHAEIEVQGERVRLRDLDSRNGTFVDGARVTSAALEAGCVLSFGQIPARVEHVTDGDVTAGVALPVGAADDVPSAGALSTVRTKPLETFARERLPQLLALVAEGASPAAIAQAGGAALFETLPVLALDVYTPPGGDEDEGLLFTARREVGAGSAAATTVAGRGAGVRLHVPQPASVEPFRPLVESVLRMIEIARRQAGRTAPGPALGEARPPEPVSLSATVRQVYTDAARVARGDVGVLILGESGTGKEVLARYVHAASARAQASFVALNCAALPRDLLEAELFGIERGVATGVEARAGKFELAHGGTLFLDEIGDMALDTQAKLLRVLQEKAVHRIGAVSARAADVRILAATNRDIQALLVQRAFREDLYYRIATWTAELPPLRRRAADIPNLAVHFLARAAARAGVRVAGVSRAALELLSAYDWPGNIRQLENEMARAVLFLGDGELLDSARLGPHVKTAQDSAARGLAATLEKVEREELKNALAACGGDVAQAAVRLGLGRSTLYRRMHALGIEGQEAEP